ncbi:MAG: SO_0444 family Cu/Zn efflux transporter [Thermodesulfobacteriota bacterium]|nr:SO_0444 family Cu/Zn efflux transporter [Thermodesulfobacteriota bacterium]
MSVIYQILKESWLIYLDVAIYMLFGFFVAGILYVFFKAEKIKQYLGTSKIKPVILSALFGIPIPLCSCGVVPVATALKKQGANSGAALSFMIATPESGVDSIAVSWAMLDPIMTVIRPVAGFITAVSTGIAENIFGADDTSNKQDMIKKTGACDCAQGSCTVIPRDGKTLPVRLINGIKYGYGELLTDIAKPFTIGIFVAGLITFLFPDDLTLWANDHNFLSMLAMLAAGIPMYVCATASTPIAAALILKGLNPGAALVFLLAGPATNAATINIIKNIFSTRVLVIYLSMITICSLATGLFVDWLYAFYAVEASAVIGQAAQIFPQHIQLIAAAILTVLIVVNVIANFNQRAVTDA